METTLKLSELTSAIVRNPLVVSPDDMLIDAIAQMSNLRSQDNADISADTPMDTQHNDVDARSSCVLVVDFWQKIVGILTERDLLQKVAQFQPLDLLTMREVMRAPIVSVNPEEIVSDVLAIMERRSLRELVVIGDRDELLGIVTETSLLKALNLQKSSDISDCKQTENYLKRNDERFRRIFDSSVVGMFFADFHGHITEANDRFLEMTGYSREELCSGKIDWLGMTPPEYIERDYTCMEELIERGEVAPWEKEYYRKDGSRIAISIGIALLKGTNHETICVVTDISDRKQAENLLRQQAGHEILLRGITQRIRQSLDLNTIFDTACQEIGQLLHCDRVGIFKFYPESNCDDGEFVAESVADKYPSVLKIRVHDHCFGNNYAADYAQGQIHAMDDIYACGLDKCHSEILEQFQVRANLVIPLLCGSDLWGLLCVHQCDKPRHWQEFEIDLTQQISSQLAIAIQQANLYEKIQTKLHERKQAEAKIANQLRRLQTLAEIVEQIRESLNLNEILARVTQQVRDVLDGDRAIVFQLFPDGKSQIVEESVCDGFVSLKGKHWNEEVWSQDILDCYWQGQPRIVPDVMNDIWTDCLVQYCIEGQIQSKIVAPIFQEIIDSETNRWNDRQSKNRLWGILVVHACSEKRVWKDSDAQLLQQIANQLAIAIKQANLFEKAQQEIRDREEAERQLRQSNHELARATRLKDEFLANMSHELRTPLNAILGMTEGLQEEVFGSLNQKQIGVLSTIEKSGNHLLELINDILDLSKIEAGKLTIDLDSTNVHHLCQSSVMFVKQQAMQKNIKLEMQLPKFISDIAIDERRIRQVLINLLNNAVKFTPENGNITLEVTVENAIADSSPKHWLKFAVIDTGIGIAPDGLTILFQPFIQIDSALNRKYEGTGLGLALVKRIVELHGGRVSVTSQLGIGSNFVIELPYTESISQTPKELANMAKDSVTTSNDGIENVDGADTSPLILLAEDNEANVITISSYLEAKGYRLVIAYDGQQAIELVRSQSPDLVLMDIQMPNMDGLAAIAWIRQNYSTNIPIIAITALAMTGDREKCLESGADDYLSKPIKLKQLATLIEQFL